MMQPVRYGRLRTHIGSCGLAMSLRPAAFGSRITFSM